MNLEQTKLSIILKKLESELWNNVVIKKPSLEANINPL
jgi:hypothetical protein